MAVDGAGNVVIADSAGTPLWAPTGLLVPGAELTSGQSITTPGGAFRLTMQGDGNLVLYGASNSALWASGTSGTPGPTSSSVTTATLWSTRPPVLCCGLSPEQPIPPHRIGGCACITGNGSTSHLSGLTRRRRRLHVRCHQGCQTREGR